PLAREAALKTLAIDPDVAEAHYVLGSVDIYLDHDWTAGERALARALELSPHFPEAHRTRGWLFASAGAFDRALPELRRAVELDARESGNRARVRGAVRRRTGDGQARRPGRSRQHTADRAPDLDAGAASAVRRGRQGAAARFADGGTACGRGSNRSGVRGRRL